MLGVLQDLVAYTPPRWSTTEDSDIKQQVNILPLSFFAYCEIISELSISDSALSSSKMFRLLELCYFQRN